MERRQFIFIVIFIPIISILFFISYYSINIPFQDQWSGFIPILEALNDNSLHFSHLWSQHNEHRLLFPKLIMIALASFSHWNVIWEQYFSMILQLCTLLIIFGIAKDSRLLEAPQIASIFKIVSSMLLFSMVQFENWYWGWQLQLFMNILAFCFAVWAITKWRNNWYGFFLAVAGSVVATFSFANGMASWIVILVLLIFQESHHKKCRIFIWIIIFCAVFFTYIYHYEKPTHHPSLLIFLEDHLTFFTFILIYIGAPFGAWIGKGASVTIGILGLGTYLTLVFTLIISHRDILKISLPWLIISLYILLSAIIISLGRSGFGAEQALFSRYHTFSIIFWTSFFAFLLSYLYNNRPIFKNSILKITIIILFSFFICFYSISYAYGVSRFKEHFNRLSEVHTLLGYEKSYGAEHQFNYLLPTSEQLYNSLKTLQKLSMGPFYNDIREIRGTYIQGAYLTKVSSYLINAFSKDNLLFLDNGALLICNIEFFESGEYELSAELEFSQNNGILIFAVDGKTIGKTESSLLRSKYSIFKLKWKYYDHFFIIKGVHKLSIIGSNGPNTIRAISFKKING